MSIPESHPERVYYTARKLLPYLEPPLRHEIARLLEQAERGEKTSYAISKRLSEGDDFTRAWMRSALYGEVAPIKSLARNYQPTAGDIGRVRAGSRWQCPEPGCDFTWRAPRAGWFPPPCPAHKVALVPATGAADDTE